MLLNGPNAGGFSALREVRGAFGEIAAGIAADEDSLT